MSPTRRDFLTTSAAVAVGGLLARPSFGWAWPLQEVKPVFTALRRNVGTFTMRGGTIGWLVNPDAVVVVDSQFPEEAKTCIAGLNERSGNRPVDCLVNTHHHGDHTGGNISFRGIARSVVAQTKAAEDMHNPPGGQPPEDQLYPDVTFARDWAKDVGDEHVTAKWYSRAHTSGDVVVTFERANVAHMGDLMFNRRHPVVDRAAGATLRGWMTALDGAMADHDADTRYIFGHAGADLPVTGTRADLVHFQSYLGAVLDFVQNQVKAGHSRDEVMAMREPLKGFEEFGPFGRENPREILTCAYAEVTEGA